MSIVEQIQAKKIYVGDPHQSIYGFRGTLNAMQFAQKQFYLSNTFRYSQEIADIASDVLQEYKAEKKRIKSSAINPNEDRTHAYLCRNNSTMIEIINEFEEEGVYYKTIRDPKDIFSVAINILEFRINKVRPTDTKFSYFKNFDNINDLQMYIEESNDRELATAFRMQQIYGKRLYPLMIGAKKKFNSKEECDIFLTSAHISKGLEWGSVTIKNDFPNIDNLLERNKISSPEELQKLERENSIFAHEVIQEINLLYVAITRAKHTVEFE